MQLEGENWKLKYLAFSKTTKLSIKDPVWEMWVGRRYNWRPLGVKDIDVVATSTRRQPYEASLPRHYQYKQLIEELPYRTIDVIIWIWTLKELMFPISIQFKILYDLLK